MTPSLRSGQRTIALLPRPTRRRPPGRYEEYHPYGSTAWWSSDGDSEVSQKRYRYTGMERDEETGLQCHGVRYYAVWLGRWVSADPIGLGDGVNRFCYCHGDPCGGRDGTGMRREVEVATPERLLNTSKENRHLSASPSLLEALRAVRYESRPIPKQSGAAKPEMESREKGAAITYDASKPEGTGWGHSAIGTGEWTRKGQAVQTWDANRAPVGQAQSAFATYAAAPSAVGLEHGHGLVLDPKLHGPTQATDLPSYEDTAAPWNLPSGSTLLPKSVPNADGTSTKQGILLAVVAPSTSHEAGGRLDAVIVAIAPGVLGTESRVSLEDYRSSAWARQVNAQGRVEVADTAFTDLAGYTAWLSETLGPENVNVWRVTDGDVRRAQ